MGTTNQIIHKKIGKRMRIGAIVLSPFILIGVASIIFQLSSGKSGEYALFDFNLGKLWSWAVSANKEVEPTVANYNLIPKPVVQNVESTVSESPVNIRELLKTQPREVSSVQNAFSLDKPVEVNSFKIADLTDIKPVSAYIGLKAERFFEPMVKEFLISPDIVIKKSKLAVGASFAPSLTFRTLQYSNIGSIGRYDNGTVYTYGQSQEYRKKNDKAIMNFYSGIDLYIQVAEKWTIQSGFYYASYGEKLQVIRQKDGNANSRVTASNGSSFEGKQALFDSPEMVEYNEQQKIPFSNYYGMLEVPLMASYSAHHFNDQLSLNIQGGVSYSYMDHADLMLYDYETNQYYWINHSSFELLNRHFMSVVGGVSISQYITKEIEVFANPQFKYALTPTFTSTYEIEQHQWATGLRLGMKINL